MQKKDIIEDSASTSEEKSRKGAGRNFFIGLLIFIGLFVGVLTTGTLLQDQQDIRQQAETNLNACGQTGGFCETFDSNPTSPMNLGGLAGKNLLPNWQMAVHSRDTKGFFEIKVIVNFHPMILS